MTNIRLSRLGGPTVLIEIEGWRFITDPTFDQPGRKYSFGFGSASTKIEGPAIRADTLGHIDAVLLSHDHHADNLDVAGRAILSGIAHVITTRSGQKRLGTSNVRAV